MHYSLDEGEKGFSYKYQISYLVSYHAAKMKSIESDVVFKYFKYEVFESDVFCTHTFFENHR